MITILLYFLSIPLVGMIIVLIKELQTHDEVQQAKNELRRAIAKKLKVYELLDWINLKMKWGE